MSYEIAKEKFLQALADDASRISTGAYRAVFLIDGYAFKVPHTYFSAEEYECTDEFLDAISDDCQFAQETEWETWKNATPELREHLVPIVDFFDLQRDARTFSVVVMPEVSTLEGILDPDENYILWNDYGMDTYDYFDRVISFSKAFRTDVKAFYKLLNECNIYDLHTGNLTVIDEKLSILDYGGVAV